MKQSKSNALVMAAFLAFASPAFATTSVVWNDPADGSTFPVGTSIIPTGQATASGQIGGSGLDLALVIDVSGSMSGQGIAAAKAASLALVDSLPANSTSVAVITFEWTSHLVKILTPLNPTKQEVIDAINSLTAGGNTATGSGIQTATTELTGTRHTLGRSMQMVVLSDGNHNTGPAPETAATAAYNLGITVNTVGTPGHNPTELAAIAANGGGVYTSSATLDQLVGIFSGTSGSLVGIDHVIVTMPDGTSSTVLVSGLGTFSAPDAWALHQGPQTWTATAYATDQSSATATLTVYGQAQGTPDAGCTLALMGLALLPMLSVVRKTKV